MKKMWVLLLLACCLAGCAEAEVFETVEDEAVQQAMAQPREISLTLPEDTVLPVMETQNGTLYMCRNFDVMVQTLPGGDLEDTICQITGKTSDDLTIISTVSDGLDCYEFVWTAAGDTGEQVCRGMILDDGDYHYVLTAMADADEISEYQQIWNGMFDTFGVT